MTTRTPPFNAELYAIFIETGLPLDYVIKWSGQSRDDLLGYLNGTQLPAHECIVDTLADVLFASPEERKRLIESYHNIQPLHRRYQGLD